MRNTQREKRAEAKRFLSRFDAGIDIEELKRIPVPEHEMIYKPTTRGTLLTGENSDDTQNQKKNTKFNWKNPSDSDVLRIIIALNVVIILINIFRR